MFTDVDAIIAICLEGFFYGKISVCALACILAEKVQLFLSGVGLYSRIFVMYLQCASKNSRMAIIIFYVLCLLYVLSTATFVSDLIAIILEVSYNSICQNIFLFFIVVKERSRTPSAHIQIDYAPAIFTIQTIVNNCCDFLTQCILVRINHCTYHPFYSPKSSKIYRCWIVWSQNIRVVAIPSFLAIAYLGQSIYLHLISQFRFISRLGLSG